MLDRFRSIVPFNQKESDQEKENLLKLMVKKTIDLGQTYGEYSFTHHNDTSSTEEWCQVFSFYNEEKFRATVSQSMSGSGDFEHESELLVSIGHFDFLSPEGVIKATFSSRSGDSFKAVKRVPGSIRYERKLPKRIWQAIIRDYLNSIPEEETTDLVPSSFRNLK